MDNTECSGFGGLPEEFCSYNSSKIVVLPVPFEKTSSWVCGSCKGPESIIRASHNMELYDIETDSEVYKKGIFTESEITGKSSDEMISQVYEKTRQFLNNGKFAVILGGEHTVSLGSIKAHSEFFKNLSILHLDAHLDTRDSYEGSKYSHACIMARARELTANIVSVGIRSASESEKTGMDTRRTFFAHDIQGSNDWIEKVTGMLSENVYISIDLDVFDSGIMPSTGTPEPGGMDWYSVITLVKAVSKQKNIIGFDVVELCPSENKAPDFLAAKLVYTILSHKFCNPNI